MQACTREENADALLQNAQLRLLAGEQKVDLPLVQLASDDSEHGEAVRRGADGGGAAGGVELYASEPKSAAAFSRSSFSPSGRRRKDRD